MANTAPTFTGPNGIVTSSLGATEVTVNNMCLQADGKIVVIGRVDGKLLLQRFLSDGQADSGFSSSGVEALSSQGFTMGAEVQVQPDGKLVIIGGTNVESTTASRDLVVARLNADGSLDTGFSGDGWHSVDVGGREWGSGVTLQPNGKIVAAGYTRAVGGGEYDQLMLRFNSDGSPDTSFDGDGVVRLGLSQREFGIAPLVQPDGKLLLVAEGDDGSAAARTLYISRVSSSGQLDTSFGGTGTIKAVMEQSFYVNDAQLQRDGKILVVGTVDDSRTGETSVAVMRFHSNGSADAGFGNQGVVSFTKGGSYNDGSGMALQSDGKILIAGSANAGSGSDFGVLRLNTNGTLDTSFGDGGLVLSSGGIFDIGRAVAVQADGKVVMAGFSTNDAYAAGHAMVLQRLQANGALDPALGGKSTLGNVPTAVEHGSAVVLEPQARIFDAELAAAGAYTGARLLLQRHGGADYGDLFLPGGKFVRAGEYLYGDSGSAVAKVVTAGGGQLELQFLSGADQDNLNKLLQSLTYTNATSKAPDSIQVDWIFSDGNTGDQGSGGALSVTGTTTVNMVGSKDAPSASAQFVKAVARLPYVLQIADFGFYDDEDGDVLSAVQFDGPPGLGVLKFKGQAISGPLTVSAADIKAGYLVYLDTNPLVRVSYDQLPYRVIDSDGMQSGLVKLGIGVETLLKLGDNLDNVLSGTVNPETFYAYDGNDTINAFEGDDILWGGNGINVLNGGDGLDVAIYQHRYLSTTSISMTDGKVTVSEALPGYFSDVLTGVERVEFSNKYFAVDTAGAGGQAYRLYQAAFDRKPDLVGLGYWIKMLDGGTSLLEVARGFVASDEFKNLFGVNPDTASLVSGLYQHVLHRAPEQGGYDYWYKVLADNPGALAEVLVAFSEGNENQAALIGVISHGMEYTPYG